MTEIRAMQGVAGALWRWRTWGLLLLLLGGWQAAQAGDGAATQAREQGLLWQITSPDSGKRSYLFGTIHSEDPRVTRLAPPVQAAFDRSSRYVMEIIPDQASMQAASQAMLLDQGESLQALLGQPLYDKTVQALKQLGVPPEVTDRFKPWAAMVIMSMPRSKTGQVLDFVLYGAAIKAGKPQSGLETALEQISVFDSLPLDEQKVLLEDAVALFPQMDSMMEQMHVAYLSRDLGKLVALSDQYNRQGNAELANKINAMLIDQRNKRMAERMEAYLREGGAFVAVGALHLPGEQGLLQLLRKRGYVVTSVY
ncbi:MAG TPA: TraB/GumN family protein [Gallionellaceae bacterium]